MNRIKSDPPPASAAARIGRLVESNLTNYATATLAELSRADRAGDDTSPLLTMGLAILRARQSMRDGIRRIERQRWEAQP